MRIEADNTIGIIIDIQDKLFPAMHQKELMLENTLKLINGLIVLDIPILLTEQYPKGLGNTISEVKNLLPTAELYEKLSFSCCDEPEIKKSLFQYDKNNVIIAGIEAHVCVLQTVIDLIDEGFTPIVVENCITSRNESDKNIALKRIIHEGGIVTTYESILFELCRYAGTDTFKSISKIVR